MIITEYLTNRYDENIAQYITYYLIFTHPKYTKKNCNNY